MLYFLHGNDFIKSRKKLKSLVDLMLAKKPDASFFKIDSDNFSKVKMSELLVSQGLFENKYIVQLDSLITNQEIKEFLMDSLKEIQASENIFIWIEEDVLKKDLNKIGKWATKIQEFSSAKTSGRTFATENGNFKISEFNIFDLATKFGERKKKDLWVLYQKTKMRNIPTEEVGGILFWQLKTMFLVENSKNASEANLKPFVFNKAKNYLKNYSKEELVQISSNLVSVYHKARRSGLEYDLALEKFILEL
ncbi:MAG: hypothetical protein V1851_02620 [Patescibacteria group bacterium]